MPITYAKYLNVLTSLFGAAKSPPSSVLHRKSPGDDATFWGKEEEEGISLFHGCYFLSSSAAGAAAGAAAAANPAGVGWGLNT